MMPAIRWLLHLPLRRPLALLLPVLLLPGPSLSHPRTPALVVSFSSWRDSIVISFIAMSSVIITASVTAVGVDNNDPLPLPLPPSPPPPPPLDHHHPDDGIYFPMLGCVGGIMYSSIVQMGCWSSMGNLKLISLFDINVPSRINNVLISSLSGCFTWPSSSAETKKGHEQKQKRLISHFPLHSTPPRLQPSHRPHHSPSWSSCV